MKITTTALILIMPFFVTISAAQSGPDEAAIRSILQEEVTAWNKGDAQTYSQHFAADGTFTNILGMFFTGHQAFLDRHKEIFRGMFRGTVLRQDVVSLKFVRPDTAVVETLTWISGFSPSGSPPGTHTDAQGTSSNAATASDGERPRRMEDRRVSQRGCEADCDRARAPISAAAPSTGPQKAQKIFYFIRSQTNSETTRTPPTIIGGVRSVNRSPWTLAKRTRSEPTWSCLQEASTW